MSENRIYRCRRCRHSMAFSGERLSQQPVNSLAWDNIATTVTIIDGLCLVCQPRKIVRKFGGTTTVRLDIVGAVAMSIVQ